MTELEARWRELSTKLAAMDSSQTDYQQAWNAETAAWWDYACEYVRCSAEAQRRYHAAYARHMALQFPVKDVTCG